MKRAAVVYNPIAGLSQASDVASRAAAKLRELGFEVRTAATERPGDAVEIARELAPEIDLLVIAGGDGSLREAIEGLGEARGRITIGFLPVGNANVAARELGIPLDSERAIAVLGEGEATGVDIAFVHADGWSALVLAMLGVGWDALTVAYLDRLRHTRIGRLWYRIWADSAYILCGLLALLHVRPPFFEIEVDERPRAERARGIHVCNFRTYAKGMSMAPEAGFRSGLLHYQARRRSDWISLALHMLAALLGRHSPAFISHYGAGRKISIRGSKPLPYQIDGDYRGRARSIELEVMPEAVRVLVPSKRLHAPPAQDRTGAPA